MSAPSLVDLSAAVRRPARASIDRCGPCRLSSFSLFPRRDRREARAPEERHTWGSNLRLPPARELRRGVRTRVPRGRAPRARVLALPACSPPPLHRPHCPRPAREATSYCKRHPPRLRVLAETNREVPFLIYCTLQLLSFESTYAIIYISTVLSWAKPCTRSWSRNL